MVKAKPFEVEAKHGILSTAMKWFSKMNSLKLIDIEHSCR